MRAKLTKTTIRSLQPKATRYEVSDTEIPAFRVRVTPAGIKTFALRYRNASNKTCLFTIGKFGDLTPEAARDIAQKKLAEIALGNDPAAAKQKARREAERAKTTTLGGFLDLKYGPWVEANRKTGAATLARIRACFGDLMARPLPDVNSWLIENWRKDRLKQGRSPSTVNRDLVALKAALQKAVDWELIDAHPLAKVKPAKVDKAGIVRYLSADEENRLRKALATRDAEMKAARARGNVWREERGLDPMPDIGVYGDHLTPMVLLSINTGLRRGELFNLTWQDIANDVLTVRGTGAKSGKTRHIPLNSEAASVLREWKDQTNGTSGLVFVGKTGARFNNVKKAWAALL
ncbi:MAG: integrase family protein, partial [Thiohalocapsa sp.]